MEPTNNNGMYMPVMPAYASGGIGGLLGGGNDILGILFIIALCGGGFGFGGLGGWGGMMGGMWGMEGLYPWLNNSQNINNGFRDQMLNTSINGIQQAVTAGFGDVQNSLCGGFASVNATVNNAQNALSQQLYTNQIADLERSFAAQTATTGGLTNVSAQLAQIGCNNAAATQDVKYTIATEGCASRATSTANTQLILDKLCQLELDNKNDKIASLERQLTMANLAASQNAQTAALTADNAAQTQYIVNRVAPYPTPAYIVQNPNGCAQNTCGCGCNYAA